MTVQSHCASRLSEKGHLILPEICSNALQQIVISQQPRAIETTMCCNSKRTYSLLIRSCIAMLLLASQSPTCEGQNQPDRETTRQHRTRLENQTPGATPQITPASVAVAASTSDLSTRISRIERILLSPRPYTGVSVKEARAALALALA